MNFFTNWKLRLLLAGCIIAVLGVVLLILRGFSIPFVALIAVGIVLFVIGIIWKPKVKTEDNHIT